MKLNSSLVKQLIKEAIADRIKMIDEAGDIAALEAKIRKVEEDIKDAMAVKASLTSMEGLKYYVNPEIISDMMDDMEASIKEEIRNDQVEGALVGQYQQNIVARLNALTEKTDVTSNGENINEIKISIIRPDTKELE